MTFDGGDTENILKQALSWCGINGLMYTDGKISWSPAPVSLVPSSLPRNAFDYGKSVSPIFNILVDKISRDKEFLLSSLAEVSAVDEFTRKLMDLYEELSVDAIQNSVQLGIHRSDYMLQDDEVDGSRQPTLLQVELNTIASSFGCLSRKVIFLMSSTLITNFT